MSFDGLFLRKLQTQISAFLPARINKIQGISDTDLLFHLHANKTKRLLISTHSQYNRVHFSTKTYTTFETPSNFIMVLRKHLEGGTLQSFEQLGLDRAFLLTIEKRDELGDLHTKYLYLELMGKYANLILVDHQNKIVDALKRIPPFSENLRTIHPGATFHEVPPQAKKNPFETAITTESIEQIQKEFFGFSKLLATEVHERILHQESFSNFIREFNESDSIYIYSKEQRQFHCVECKHLMKEATIYPLMEGLDFLFNEREEQERIRQQSGDLYKIVKKEVKKNKGKLPKLYKTLEQAYTNEKYREYGDLLFAYQSVINTKKLFVQLPSFERDEEVRIELDPRLDLKGNANKYYRLYHKSKTAIIEMNKQIETCESELDYLESIETQLQYATFQDAQEIRQELVDHRLLSPTANRLRKTKGKVTPNILKFVIDGVHIYVGKNNVQNDYITFTLGRKNHTWLHAKDIHGSHVLILDENPSEHVLRTGAQLASYYSKARHSSSVPVNYTSMKNIKKPSKKVPGLVFIQNYKTIYIDPEETIINSLLEKNQIK